MEKVDRQNSQVTNFRVMTIYPILNKDLVITGDEVLLWSGQRLPV